MVGEDGSNAHKLLIPKIIGGLAIRSGDRILDIGCGQGILASHVIGKNGSYTGVDISKSLIEKAQKRNPAQQDKKPVFLVGNAHNLKSIQGLTAASFDSAVFLLSIQDMRYPKKAIASAAWALNPGGRLVICMTHPAFRIPRQSGWGYDEKRKLLYRRVDGYLSSLDIPLRKDYTSGKTLTRSYHRPIGTYINTLALYGLHTTGFEEILSPEHENKKLSKAEKHALAEFPLFLMITAEKTPPEKS
jgi:ubiquinone/menaquinone biosynthesis C-methylase UbiE